MFAAGRALSRARLSAYSGFTAGFFRLHAQPTWVVAAFDVAAVALVVGTLHVLGTIASGKGVPDIIPPAEANVPGDMSVIAETTVPHVTVRERGLATASDHSLLFSDPVVFNPYLQSLPGAPSTGSFTGGEAETAATEQPVPAQPPVSALPPSAEIAPALLSYTGVTAGKVARTAKRLVPAAGKALDELMPGGRSVVSSLTAATDLDGSVSLAPSRVHVAAGPADVTADVSHAATTVAGVAGATTKTVGNAVGTVAGAASGAVGGVTHSALGGVLH
jgi:hypothetical protein